MLKNRQEIIRQLTNFLMDLDAEKRPHQTDIYLYLDQDGRGELSEFVNPGGSSWRNDAHYTIYSQPAHDPGDDYVFDYELDDLLSLIGKSREEVEKEMGAEESCSFYLRIYICEHYHDLLVSDYRNHQDTSLFHDKASEIINEFEAQR